MLIDSTPLKKFTINGVKVKKWNDVSGKKIWSGSSEVTRYIQGVAQPIYEVDEGLNVVSALPTPIVENAVFVGWATANGNINTESVLLATGEPMTVYAVFDYPVISGGNVANSSFIQSSSARPTAGYADSPTHYGGDWHGAVVGWEDGQWGSFSCNFVLATKAVGMRCSCDLYGYISGRYYDKESDIGASASISGIGTYYGAWHERKRYYPVFTVGSNNRTFSFAGKYAGSSPNWMPLAEAGCVNLTLRGN